LIETTNFETNYSYAFKEPFQIDELGTSNSDSKRSTYTTSKQINVLSRDQEFILEATISLNDPQLQKKKTYLDKFVSTFDKLKIPQPIPSTNTNTYNLTKILNKKKKSKPVTNTML
jgi:organic radical activating enzyme